jgi:hypothetical protein
VEGIASRIRLKRGARRVAALLEAFDGKSDRPPPWLRVRDLEIWLAARVKELTKGAQTPRTTIPGERLINPRVFMVQQQVR